MLIFRPLQSNCGFKT
uniref:Uncharacterized protein n=1 Tax=Anguilla anguilla TaxID=7936 RepID=A0A0E9R0U2_ANGAN